MSAFLNFTQQRFPGSVQIQCSSSTNHVCRILDSISTSLSSPIRAWPWFPDSEGTLCPQTGFCGPTAILSRGIPSIPSINRKEIGCCPSGERAADHTLLACPWLPACCQISNGPGDVAPIGRVRNGHNLDILLVIHRF